MRFTMTSKLALALATLFITAECAPADTSAAAVFAIPSDPDVVYTPGSANVTNPVKAGAGAVTKRAINDCGDSTFENKSSGGSPTVADCWTLYNNIVGDGTWTVWGPDHHTIATYGSCAFGVTVAGIGWANIGNGDIRDLVRDSINKYQWNGLVGSKGYMLCQGLFDRSVEWGLYHT